jgi:hypothetical protein
MYCDTRMGGEPQWYLVRQKDAYMNVPDNVKDCVCWVIFT